MEKLKGVHVSFDIVTEFVPRVPRQRCPGENSSIPRICAADNLYNAINAIPQAGLVLNYMKNLELPLIIHAYYLKGNGMKNEDVQKICTGCKPDWGIMVDRKARESVSHRL